MLLAETETNLTAALIAVLLALVPLIQIVTTILQTRQLRKDNKRVEDTVIVAAADAAGAAADASRAAETAQGQAEVMTNEVKAVHATLNGTGILGTLKRIETRQEAHEIEDKAHFARTDEKLEEVIKEARETRVKVTAAVQKGIVIEPSAPEAR
jgi:hypothetical protein